MSNDASPHHQITDTLLLPALVVIGMGAGLVAYFLARPDLALIGYGLVYLAGGLPAAWQARSC